MEITPACYSHLLSPLLGLANGKVAVVLEVLLRFINLKLSFIHVRVII